MKILVICHYGMYEDLTSSFVHHQAAAYVALGHRVRVLVPKKKKKNGPSGKRLFPGLECHVVDGVEIYYLRFVSLSNYGRIYFNTPSAVIALRIHLAECLRGFRPEVIHAHTLGFDSEIGAWLKGQLHVPLVVTTHGSDSSVPMERGEGDRMKHCCDQADVVVAVSSVLAEKLRACGTKTPICSILNGFVLEYAEQEEKRPYSMVQTGTLSEQKRVSVTIRAFAQLKKRYPEFTLTVIGSGPDRETLEELCRKLHVDGSVRFLGQLPHGEALVEMSKAQFFVMPSVREGFGIVYLEAMASGCITIGTEGEGIIDLIVSGKNGFLVPPDSPEAIAEKIELCLTNPEWAQKVAKCGQENARTLTWTHNAEQYVILFRSLVEGRLSCVCTERDLDER